VLREAQLSLKLDRPFSIMVLNAATPELSDASVYKGLSGGKARVEAVSDPEPQKVLGDPKNRERLRAVVMDKPWQVFPHAGTPEARRLDSAVKQLDEIFLLATRRLAPLEAGASPQTAEGRRFRDLAQAMGRVSGRGAESAEALERQVREFWRQVS